jgi:Zn-finger nucleic acid-binding protein
MERGLACPRCGSALFAHHAPDIELLACGRCFGLWLDNRGCHLLVDGALSEAACEAIRDVDAQPAPGAPPPPRAVYRAPAREGGDDEDAARACPVCGAPLKAHVTDEEQQGIRVRLDVCPPHGTWFDRGEAWTLLQAVQLRQFADDVAIEAQAAEQRWRAREFRWVNFVAGARRR